MLGKDKPRKYLVLFQNDAELRPTGGFLTGFAVIQVDKGKISVIQSDDIYKLDEKFPKRIPAPDPIKNITPMSLTGICAIKTSHPISKLRWMSLCPTIC